ncbi:MAG: RNA polymerase sigma factor [Candidatus Angelobacter sp.]
MKFRQWKVGAVTPSRTMADRPCDDQELLRQLTKGNQAAFRDLYERYQGRIYRFALHMSGNPATAEETTQEVFMALIGKRHTYDPARGPVSGYLFGIARNITRRAMQGSQFDVSMAAEDGEQDELVAAAGLDALEELSNGELLAALRQAVLGLPPQYRETVVLCDLEEMSYQEAAELLDCSPGTVASRLSRGRALLKKKLSVQNKNLSVHKCAK